MNGTTKSYALDKLQLIVTETLADCYAQLHQLAPHLIRKDDYKRDCEYILKRSNAEGQEFFTVALANLGEFFDNVLLGNAVERVEGFKPFDGLYPVFLRPFWIYTTQKLVPVLEINTESADEFTVDQAQMIRLIRSLLHGLKKYYAFKAPVQGQK